MTDTYVTAIPAVDMFVDHTYQRDLDLARAKTMAASWDRRLVGILDVCDRGADTTPRYAVIDGQHRWAAAALHTDDAVLVANVHTGLAIAEEAELFGRLNRERRRITTWDHWHARKASGDKLVSQIETVAGNLGLRIDSAPKTGNVRCTATLEKLHTLGGRKLVYTTLTTIKEVWGRDLAAYDAPIVHGLGLVLHHLGHEIETVRLYDALVEIVPQQVKATALALRQSTTGTLPKLVAITIMNVYNRRPGKKLLVSTRTFGASSRNAHSVRNGREMAGAR